MELTQHHGAADRYLLRLVEKFHETEKHFHDVLIGIGYGQAGVRLFLLSFGNFSHFRGQISQRLPVEIKIKEQKRIFGGRIGDIGSDGHVHTGNDALVFRVHVFFPADEGMLGALNDKPRERLFEAVSRLFLHFPPHKVEAFDGRQEVAVSPAVLQKLLLQSGVQFVPSVL